MNLDLNLWDKQGKAFLSPATEILYGGAAGGGKSHLMRVAAIAWSLDIPGLQTYIFRKIYEDLVKNHMEGPKGFRSMLAPLMQGGWCEIIQDEIRFYNGSKIYLCHCQHDKDRFKYQGSEIHVLLVDELTHFSEVVYRFLRSRNRAPGLCLPDKYHGMFPRILCSANPGGVGHTWVKNTWVVANVPMQIRRMSTAEGGMLRQFIPARLEDNPSLAEDDPNYETKLEGLGSKQLVAAIRWGDWNVVEGAFFDCFEERKHVLTPMVLPRDWLRFRSADWGSASPCSIGWWAVVQDDYHLPMAAGGSEGRVYSRRSVQSDDSERAPGRVLPRGALVRYRELYTDTPGVTGKGQKLTAEEVAKRIVAMERDDPKLAYGVLDPSVFKEDGGPPISERINRVLLDASIAPFRKADNARVRAFQGTDRRGPMSGWDMLRARMVGTNGRPMVYCFSTCMDSIRTIPALQHDPVRAEDVLPGSEDHCADEWRYAALSRPWLKTVEPPPKPRDGYSIPHDELISDSIKLL